MHQMVRHLHQIEALSLVAPCSFSLERTHCQEFHPTNTTKQNQRLHIKLLAFWQTLNCSASVNSTQCSDHVFVRINRLADPNTSALRAPVMRLVALVGCLKNPHILQFYTTDQYTRLICVFQCRPPVSFDKERINQK